ncbi:MFS transporter [Sulfitobacter sp. HNIBRBA2951]|uniref:MFS transporter n=1 Tax=Sulfitobacter aquimarinus TaxID=3158557 RepID=UPI0032DF66D5
MVRQLLPISALLLGTAFLFFAGGINALVLPIRGNHEGFTAFSLGLLGSGWAIGYVSGCIFTPKFVSKVGHIRAFSVVSAFAALAILASLLLISPYAWIPLRAISGFCFAAAAMIIESWLGERADASSRGKIFGFYTMIQLGAITLGQMSLALGESVGFTFFVIGAMFYCLALVPTAVSSVASPKPLTTVKLDLKGLWKNSPVAVFAVFMVGISNGSFGTLAAVYADRIGLVLTGITLFASIPILTGALVQIPVGYFSDRVDRRKVLLFVVLVALIADVAFIVSEPQSNLINMILVGLFGAGIFGMYPVIVAHANDHAPSGTFIQVSGGLLLVFGLGSIVGPLVSGVAMAKVGTQGLFITSFAAHVLIFAFTLWRITKRAPVEDVEKGTFVASPSARASTPETAAMHTNEAGDAQL